MKLLHTITLQRHLRALVSICVCVVSVGMTTAVWSDAAAIKVGETDLTPKLQLDYFSDDNVFRTDANASDATGVRVKPSLFWLASTGLNEVGADYRGEFSRSGIESTDFDNHSLRFFGSAEFSKRSKAKASIKFSRNIEELGTGVSIGLGDTLSSNVVLNDVLVNLSHNYGARGARGNFGTRLAIRNRSYSNSENFANRPDYLEISPAMRFSLRLSGSTRGFAELGYRYYDYESDFNDRDEFRFSLGSTWEESQKFGGSAQIGSISYSYPSADRDSGTEFGLKAGIFYRPVNYSRFDLSVDRSLYDLVDNIDSTSTEASVRDTLNIDWRHDWSSRLSHEANWNLEIVERSCSQDNEVTSDTSVQLLLKLRRWVTVGTGLAFESRNFDGCGAAPGTDTSLDYTKQMFDISIYLTL